jgi:hypothetical protein
MRPDRSRYRGQHSEEILSLAMGYFGCIDSLLMEAQEEQVRKSALRRNFANCEGGYSGCGQALLTNVEKEQGYKPVLQRSLASCDGAYSRCN